MYYNEHDSTTYLLLFSDPKNKHFLNKLEFKRMVAQSVGLDKRLKVHSSDCVICQKHVCAAFKKRMMAFSVPRQNDFRHARRAASCSLFSTPSRTKQNFHVFFKKRVFLKISQNNIVFLKNIKKQLMCLKHISKKQFLA